MELRGSFGYDSFMWPVIFSLGKFELKTFLVFMIVAFFVGGYVFWRRSREEHYSEEQLFDGFLSSLAFGALLGRIVYIFFNLEKLGFNPIHWLDVFSYPGINSTVLFLAAGWYLYRFSLSNRWDVFEVMDFAVSALSLSLAFLWLGLFFDGTAFGVITTWFVGVVFPGVFDKHHPVQLYYMIFYLGLFVYLANVEYKYRTFAWYRHGKKTAQTGFLTSMYFILSGGFSFLVGFISQPSLVFGGIRFDLVLSVAALVFGLFLLGLRSGRISTKFLGRRNRHLLENLKV